MRGVEKPSRVLWPPKAKFRQEKFSQSEDNLLKVGVRAQRHHVLIKWKCPPQISLLDEWRVVAGEESVELEVQKQREKSLSEQFYFHRDSVPPNPSISRDLDNQYQNDSYILHVPLIPIEEEEEVTKAEQAAPTIEVVPHNLSLPQLNPDSRKYENVSTAQCYPCVSSRPVAKDGSSRHVIPGMPDQKDIIVSREPPANSASASGVDPTVAADVVLAAFGQRDLIEVVPHNSSLPQLNPDSRKYENVSTAQCYPCVSSRPVAKDGSSRHVIPGIPNQKDIIVSREPPANSASASGVDPTVAADVELAAFSQRDLIDMDMLTLLLSNPEMIDQLMNRHGLAPNPKIETSPKSNSLIASTPSASPPSSMPNLFSEKRVTTGNTECAEAESTVLSGPVKANVWHPHAGLEQVFGLNPMAAPAPLASSMPRTSSCRDECRARPQAGMSNMAGIYPSTPLTPKLSLGQAKKLISEYGAPETVGQKPLTRAEHSTNMPVCMERLKKLINEYGAPESVGHNPSPKTTHPFSLQSNLPAMPISPNIVYAPSFSPKMNPAPRKDLGYDSPISQQKEKKEKVDALLLKYLRPDLHLQEPVSLHNSKPCEPSYPTTSKYQKSCKFFNTSRGCRRGSKCRFQHDAVEYPCAKRMKLPKGMFQGRRVTEGITG